MKKSFEEVSERVQKSIAKNRNTLLGAVLTGGLFLPQFVNAGTEIGDIVNSIASVVVNIFPFVGLFFILAGVFKLIMAYRSDQPEGQSAAAKDIVIGAVFIVFRVFAWAPISNAIGKL